MTSAPTTSQTTDQGAVRIPRPSLVARLLGTFSGPLGIAMKFVLLALANALGIWAFDRSRSTTSGSSLRRSDRHDRDRPLLPAAGAPLHSGQVPRPRRDHADRLPGRPDRLQRRHRVHELVDRPQPDQGRGDLGHRGGLARSASRRAAIRDDARQGAAPARAPARRRRRAAGPTWAPRTGSSRFLRRTSRSRTVSSLRRRGTRCFKATSSRASTSSSPTSSSRSTGTPSSVRRGSAPRSSSRPTLRYDPAADTFTNIETGLVYTTTARAPTLTRRARCSSRGGASTSASTTSSRSSPTRSSATRSSASSSGRSSTPDSPCS